LDEAEIEPKPGEISVLLGGVGRMLREQRTSAGLSLDDVARVSGVARSAVARLERGDNPNPTVATLYRVMVALGGELTIGFEPPANTSRPIA
jgi:transcriptional regulator with XRE-family HTH domain